MLEMQTAQNVNSQKHGLLAKATEVKESLGNVIQECNGVFMINSDLTIPNYAFAEQDPYFKQLVDSVLFH